MKNDKGFFDMHQPMSKTQPGKASQPSEGNTNYGDAHEFNQHSFGTNTGGSDYHDTGRPDSGLHGNFAQKDASVEYLRNRGKEGMEIRHFSGTHEQARIKTENQGVTAYPNRPIDEVYKPATSQHTPYCSPVVRPNYEVPEVSTPETSQKNVTKRMK